MCVCVCDRILAAYEHVRIICMCVVDYWPHRNTSGRNPLFHSCRVSKTRVSAGQVSGKLLKHLGKRLIVLIPLKLE